ncbi:MAG TPA: phosphatidylglycerophosphatase A [Rickettsiales bacterium]|nr:phosphatidylglycerophosphatase A [Rickettsiales bacterium]
MKKKANKQITDKEFTVATFISTCFGVGFIKFCPGTMGSLLTFPLFYILNIIITKSGIETFIELILIYFIILIFLFVIGFWSVDIYISKNKKDDPSEVVIDEVIGQMIAYMMPTCLTLYYFIYLGNSLATNSLLITLTTLIIITAPIIFFRLFDILKPGLVGYFDTRVKGPIGVIMDDVIAGLYAGGIVCTILTLLFLGISIY